MDLNCCSVFDVALLKVTVVALLSTKTIEVKV